MVQPHIILQIIFRWLCIGWCIKVIEIIKPCSNAYADARQEWNRANDKFPEAIAYCSNYEDVKNAIRGARDKDLKIRVRSGGHNYEGYSTANGAFVIDVSDMNQIIINYTQSTVSVQGGCYLEQLYNVLGARNYPFPGGSCPTVGVSGFALGGGWGYSARYLGLGCDSLIQIEMIDYKGTLITANKKTNSDLFWACRGGGGGNFGIIVSLTFKLPSKVDQVTRFNLYCSQPSEAVQLQFLATWQDWIATAPNEINMKGSISNNGPDGISILCTGLLYGTPEDLKYILSPFLAISGFELSYEYTSFLQATEEIASVYPQYEYFQSSGRFVSNKFSYEQLKKFIDIINEEIPEGSIGTLLNVYGFGGKVSEIDKFSTAFYYRESDYIIYIESDFEDNAYKASNKRWVSKNAIYMNSITEGSYINFPFSPLKNYLCAYYGENLSRLQCVKKTYDPLNVFNFQQSIKL